MICIRNVVVYATRSRNVVSAATLSAAIYPNATYHIVAAIPKLRSRVTYTRMFQEVVEGLAGDSVHDVEMALLSEGVEVTRKRILRGDPIKSLVDYVTSTRADLLVAGSSSPSFILNVVFKILSALRSVRSYIPALIHTPRSRHVTDVKEVLLVLHSAQPEDISVLVSTDIAKRLGAHLKILPILRVPWLERHSLKTYLGLKDVDVSIETFPTSASAVEEVLEASEGADVVVLEGSRGVREMELLDKRVAAESAAPVILT